MAKCPICETFIEDNQFLEKYISPFNNQEYKLYHCPNCDLQWWEPLKMIPEFYENEGSQMYEAFHKGIRDISLLGDYHKLFFQHFTTQNLRLLDVGCGDCLFLYYAKNLGFEVWGLDLDRKSVAICREKRKLDYVYTYSLNEFVENIASKQNIKFDIITFFEVLEHQDNPIKFLNLIKRILKPNGWIAGSVPNRNSWLQRKLYQQVFKDIDHPPHHFLRFSKRSLYFLLKELGFSNITIKETNKSIKDINYTFTYILLGRKGVLKFKETLFSAKKNRRLYSLIP